MMERKWRDNQANVSCVPLGFYQLVPHNGDKYQETWALVGDAVSHWPELDIPRSACAAHWEDDALFLKGCFSVAHHLDANLRLHDPERAAITHLKDILENEDEPHYLNITAGPGYLESIQATGQEEEN